ncbi:hypothetical protein ACSVDE_14735 [Pseudalkalibacillus sp. Hm43]|uniref:hypothetical protein n=1 Tax=Pseudalkalibacillus sp. Hm43 TaxID=3450742 RepID=UPI003F4290AB
MILKKLNASIVTYWISCIVVFLMLSPTEFVLTDFQDMNSVINSFSLFSYVIFLGVFLYAYPVGIVAELILRKIPAGKSSFKFIIYIFFAIVVAVLFMFSLLGLSFFSIVVACLFFVIEELLFNRISLKQYKTIMVVSYIIFVMTLF